LPEGCRWTDLNGKSGINLLNDYKVSANKPAPTFGYQDCPH
jgi:hypothetical protein